MPKDFQIINRFKGYNTREEQTNLSPEFLVGGSQNVLLTKEGKISTRDGYELLGASSSDLNAIESAFRWLATDGTEILLRSYDDELEVYTSDFGAWQKLSDGWSDVGFRFTSWWDNTEKKEVLIFVMGNSNIYEWSGGTAKVSSVTSNTITKQGTATWAESNFYNTGNKTIIIDGTEYTYTGGETTTTLTGVSPDPSSNGVSNGDLVVQKIVTNSNAPSSDFDNDFVGVLNNQLYVGSENSRLFYLSSKDDYTDFSFSSPRVPGEGDLLTLDEKGVGFAPQNQNMLIFAGDDSIYKLSFEQLDISGTLTQPSSLEKLKTGPNRGAKSADLISTDGDLVVYISNEPKLRAVGSVENIDEPQIVDLSYDIQPDFDDEDFTNGHIYPFKDRIYIASPANSKVYINEIVQTDGQDTRIWQTPQVLPVRRFTQFGGSIRGHSSSSSESYTLFTGKSDNNKPFKSVARFAYNQYEDRYSLKRFDELLTEGYISSNTKITLTAYYDFEGSTGEKVKEIDGSDSSILFMGGESGAIGTQPIGTSPYGANPELGSSLPKFKVIKELPPLDFSEVQFELLSEGDDHKWELVAIGANASISPNQPINIKQ